MKCPLTWLRDYVDCGDSVSELSDALTFSGVEVEGIETLGADLAGFMAVRIEETKPHPNADRLTLCTVFDGAQRLPVVCGAPNVRPGQLAAFAPEGSSLPGGMQIRKAKIRGEVSRGMLCAADELGLSGDHSGILEVPPDTAPGTPLSQLFPAPETVFDLEITPNRPDCLSIVGLAREVAALYDRPLCMPDPSLEETGAPRPGSLRVEIEDPRACPRYTARVLRGATVGPSPDWMRQRLEWAGIRPINNLVDITNFVLLELGHPLHAFDLTRLREERIVVRRARPEETCTTLDGVERALTPEMLVIADGAGPVAVAGIMGGAGSEIQDSTSEILLESACFDPSLIRRTARALGLSTDSSYRFERGVDAAGVETASRRAAALMAELAGAEIAPGGIDVYPAPTPPVRVSCRWQRVRDVVGVDTPDDHIRSRLTALGLKVGSEEPGKATFDIPSFRSDLTREIDLVEEFARIHGLDKIPAPAPRARVVPGATETPVLARDDLRRDLVGLGLQEIVNYSLVSAELLDTFHPEAQDQRVVLPNPISADQSHLRTSLLPQLVDTLARNRSHQVTQAMLFELGTVFRADGPGARETLRLSLGMMGPTGRAPLDQQRPISEEEAFGWLKGMVEALLRSRCTAPLEFRSIDQALFEPGRGVSIHAGDEALGVLGLLRSTLRKSLRIDGPVPVAELEVTPLLAGFDHVERVSPVPAYPPVSRDISLFCRPDLRHGDIEAVLRRAAPKELEKIALFDIFESEILDQISLAYSLTYRAADRSLTDEDANALHEPVLHALRQMEGVEIREGESG